MKTLTIALALGLTATLANARVLKTETAPMSWATCVNKVNEMAKIVPMKIIVSTDIIATVRFKVEEGSLLVTCSKPDRQMTLIYTDNPF